MHRNIDPTPRPLLLRETAEIALTEVKRFVEPRLSSDFNLRRVSAPLCLPVGSGLNGPEEPVRFRLGGSGLEMEIVTGLDRWLRAQLVRYDTAEGFGVFAVMNAVRPDIPRTAVSSPDLCSWAWQQVLRDDAGTDAEVLSRAVRRLYAILRDTEKMLLDKFPHLHPVLPQDIVEADAAGIADDDPETDPRRMEHRYVRDHADKAMIFTSIPAEEEEGAMSAARLIVWNEMLRTPLELAEVAIFPPSTDAPLKSVGGNIWRDTLALHILHQTELLK